MSEEAPSPFNIDLATLHHLTNRIVASTLTNAIYTRLDTLQSQEDYAEDDFDAVARDVVREVMQTYSALLSVLQGAYDDPEEPENGR
jgi:ribosomal protein S2